MLTLRPTRVLGEVPVAVLVLTAILAEVAVLVRALEAVVRVDAAVRAGVDAEVGLVVARVDVVVEARVFAVALGSAVLVGVLEPVLVVPEPVLVVLEPALVVLDLFLDLDVYLDDLRRRTGDLLDECLSSWRQGHRRHKRATGQRGRPLRREQREQGLHSGDSSLPDGSRVHFTRDHTFDDSTGPLRLQARPHVGGRRPERTSRHERGARGRRLAAGNDCCPTRQRRPMPAGPPDTIGWSALVRARPST